MWRSSPPSRSTTTLAASLQQRLAGTNVTVVLGDATALEFETGRFTGAASFHMLHHIDTAEAQDRAFAELARVLRPGGVLVAADGVANEGTRAFHENDTYNPVDPDGLEARLQSAGFTAVRVGLHDLGGSAPPAARRRASPRPSTRGSRRPPSRPRRRTEWAARRTARAGP